jgi:dTDP-4-dehydrorhamnose 3,5-epimerase-like enzyme
MTNNIDQLAHWIKLLQFEDYRGELTEINFDELPFKPLRAFYIRGVPVNSVRGRHAHKEGDQILICLSGRIEVELRRNNKRETVTCETNNFGLLIKQGIWAKQTYLREDSILLVLCSHLFNKDSYVDGNGQPLK